MKFNLPIKSAFCHLLLWAVCVLMLPGCNKLSEEYTYRFTMEHIGNYRVQLEVAPDSTFKIEQHNYFFDRYAGTKHPIFCEGKLTPQAFNDFRRLIKINEIRRMNNAYGFEDDTSEREMILVIEIEQGGVSTFVTINLFEQASLSANIRQLIKYTGDFISAEIKKTT